MGCLNADGKTSGFDLEYWKLLKPITEVNKGMKFV